MAKSTQSIPAKAKDFVDMLSGGNVEARQIDRIKKQRLIHRPITSRPPRIKPLKWWSSRNRS